MGWFSPKHKENNSSIFNGVAYQFETGNNCGIKFIPDKQEMQRRYYAGQLRKIMPGIIFSNLRSKYESSRHPRPSRTD